MRLWPLTNFKWAPLPFPFQSRCFLRWLWQLFLQGSVCLLRSKLGGVWKHFAWEFHWNRWHESGPKNAELALKKPAWEWYNHNGKLPIEIWECTICESLGRGCIAITCMSYAVAWQRKLLSSPCNKLSTQKKKSYSHLLGAIERQIPMIETPTVFDLHCLRE